MQPSAVRAQLSFEHWQDTQLIAGLQEGPASPERLVFNATVPRPLRRTRTLTTDPPLPRPPPDHSDPDR